MVYLLHNITHCSKCGQVLDTSSKKWKATFYGHGKVEKTFYIICSLCKYRNEVVG